MTYRSKILALSALAFLGAIAAGVVLGLALPYHHGSANRWLVMPLMFAVAAAALAASVPWWNRLDDVQKYGHMSSWYWGSMAGALAMLVWLAVTTGRHSDLSLGAIYLFFAQGAGFAFVFMLWRLRGRGVAE